VNKEKSNKKFTVNRVNVERRKILLRSSDTRIAVKWLMAVFQTIRQRTTQELSDESVATLAYVGDNHLYQYTYTHVHVLAKQVRKM
jgi:hypothetical protein